MDSLYGKPYGVNYAPATPLRAGLRSYFANDVVRAVGVSGDVPPICRPVQPPLHTPATDGGRGLCRIEDRQRVAVQEAGLAGVALLGDEDVNAHQLRLVGQRLNEACMGHSHKVLIVAPRHVDLLLPERVLADAQRATALGYQQIDDTAAGRVQIPVYATGAPRGDALQVPTGAPISQPALQFRAALVVEVVDGLHWPPVDRARDKARLV